MNIYFHREYIKSEIKEKTKIRKWITKIIENEGKKGGTLNIILTNNNKIVELNKKYLNRKYITDIITFDFKDGNEISGDLFLSYETVKENSARFRNKISIEIRRVIAHGVLHLLGYNDSTDEEKKMMREKEDYYLNKFYQM